MILAIVGAVVAVAMYWLVRGLHPERQNRQR
jgi:hypothetical protein